LASSTAQARPGESMSRRARGCGVGRGSALPRPDEATEPSATCRMDSRRQAQDQAPRNMLTADRAGAVEHPGDDDALAALEPLDARLRHSLRIRPEDAW